MKKKASLLVLGILTLLFSSAVVSQEYLFNPEANTSFLMIPGCAFRPYNNMFSFSITSSVTNTDEPGYYYYAPVYLSHGAEIKKITTYYYTGGTMGMRARLYRRDYNSHTSGQMADVYGWSGTTGWHRKSTTSITTPIINMRRYGYFIQLWFEWYGNNYRFEGVRIKYTTS